MLAGDPNDPRVKALAWVRPGARVLEIGCGHGAVTRQLAGGLGCTVVACDVDPGVEPSLRGAAERFVCGDVGDPATLDRIRGEYDHVLLMDVLEHTSDPAAVLRALATVATERTTFIVTLPNFVVWHVRVPLALGRFEYTDTGTLDRTHLRFFTLESAHALLTGAGLDVIDTRYTWNVPWLGAVWSRTLIAETPDLDARVRRRFPRAAPVLTAVLRVQHAINEAGLTRGLDALGQAARAAAPGLLTNHVVLLARPGSAAGGAARP